MIKLYQKLCDAYDYDRQNQSTIRDLYSVERKATEDITYVSSKLILKEIKKN